MARTTKRGTCDLCGASSNVGTNHGSKVCTNCTHVQSALSKRPQSVANAIRAMGKTEEMLSALIPAGGLAVHVTAELLREISDIVGYDGEDHTELVEAVRKRVLTCASCEAEDVLAEIREIVGYTPEQGDKGLADAVLAFADRRPAGGGAECTDEEIRLRDDLARACELDLYNSHGWDFVAAAAIQEIACKDDSLRILAKAFQVEVSDSVAKTRDKAKLEDDFERALQEIETVSAKLTLAQQSRDEWEQRAVQAEQNVETLESELRNRVDAPEPCASTTYLLDIALRALRGEGPDADQLATLIDAARRAA